MATLLTKATPEAAKLPTEYISAVHETPTGKIQRETSELAEANGLNPYVMNVLIERESRYNPDAVGDHGLAKGVAQFHESTFEWMGRKADMPYLQYDNSNDQLILMDWAFKNHLQNQWGTYQRLEPCLKELL